jgi:hypothetical protein
MNAETFRKVAGKFFVVQEFIDRETYKRCGNDSIVLMSDEMIYTAVVIRNISQTPVMLNSWHTGGANQYRGYRPWDCPIGAQYSMHKEGRAIDFKIIGWTVPRIQGWIIENHTALPYIRRIEKNDGQDRVHVDNKIVKNHEDSIIFFNP